MSIAPKYMVLSALLGAIISVVLFVLLMVAYSDVNRLENRVSELETQIAREAEARNQIAQMAGPGMALTPEEQALKDLSTQFVGDPRTIAQKLRDFIAEKAIPQDMAIAAKVVAELAENRDALSDADLEWLYAQNTPLLIKRVCAQVLSSRGNNQLLDTYIAELKPGLASANPGERRRSLGELAKTRYAGAADLIAPSLKDGDTTVLLDALLALRSTGNESHIESLKPLVQHQDESVSWLASDALNNLETLSKKARHRVSFTEIVAELPMLAQ